MTHILRRRTSMVSRFFGSMTLEVGLDEKVVRVVDAPRDAARCDSSHGPVLVVRHAQPRLVDHAKSQAARGFRNIDLLAKKKARIPQGSPGLEIAPMENDEGSERRVDRN